MKPAAITAKVIDRLNRLGVTGAIDAGGSFHAYPHDHAVIQKLADDGQLTIRLAYNLFDATDMIIDRAAPETAARLRRLPLLALAALSATWSPAADPNPARVRS